MYVRLILLPFLAVGVLSSPLFSFNNKHPQLGGASSTLSGNSACPPLLPGYGALASTNVTQGGNDTIPSQTTYICATETGSSPAIGSSANVVASPSTTGLANERYTRLFGQSLRQYRFPTFDFQVLLTPAEDRSFLFRFERNGGGILIVNISARPEDSPDVPESYFSITYHAFVHSDLSNSIPFQIAGPLWVDVHLNIGEHRPHSYNVELIQVDKV